jgi:hypothetical protein
MTISGDQHQVVSTSKAPAAPRMRASEGRRQPEGGRDDRSRDEEAGLDRRV